MFSSAAAAGAGPASAQDLKYLAWSSFLDDVEGPKKWDYRKKPEFIRFANLGKFIPQVSFSPAINSHVALYSGDVLSAKCDAIAITSNPHLLPESGGLNAAVFKAAGPALQAELAKINPAKLGEVVVSKGHGVGAKYILHACCPDTEQPALLRRCYENVLEQIVTLGIRTLFLTPLGWDGRFAAPPTASTHMALQCVRKWLDSEDNRARVDVIAFAVQTGRQYDLYSELMHDYFPPEEPPPPPPRPPTPPPPPPTEKTEEKEKKKKGKKKGKKK